jgi:hypothetical protein
VKDIPSILNANGPNRARTSAVILGGMGRTVGVDGGAHWPLLSDHAITMAVHQQRTQHIIPWLIWAYGVDVKRVKQLPLVEYGTPELWSAVSPKWYLNQLIELLASHGAGTTNHDPQTVIHYHK